MTYVTNAHLAEALRMMASEAQGNLPDAEATAVLVLAARRLDEPIIRSLGAEIADWPGTLPGGRNHAPGPGSRADVIAQMREAGFPVVDPDEIEGVDLEAKPEGGAG